MRHPLALSLLVLVTALYILATAMAHHSPAWSYVAAFAEAGMVGALADWFAVVALFRRPMGLPIPHTAVLARNQQRLGTGLADFLDQNFLNHAHLRERLAQWNAAQWFASWLQKPENTRSLTRPMLATAEFGLSAMDDGRVRAFFTRNVRTALSQINVSYSTAAILDSLTAQNRHQELLDEVLTQLARVVASDKAQQEITNAVARELRALRYLALDQAAARLTTRKIVSALARNLTEMGQSADHPMRQRFDRTVRDWIDRLKTDPELQAQANVVRDQLLDHPALNLYLEQVWSDLLGWLTSDLHKPDSSLRQRLEAGLARLGNELQDNESMQQWLNAQVQTIAPQVIERYRPAIRHYISARVGQWDTRELIAEVEGHLGKDLQYIRINGTLVGGLVGLVIHTLTQLIMS